MGFQTFAAATLRRARRIVDKILRANGSEQLIPVARDMDRLSDLLCRVIDLSDFVRMTHPDPRMQAAATEAYAIMFEYMNVLNTTTGLNMQLKRALADPTVVKAWSAEEKTVANVLLKDFSKSAIEMPSAIRQRFVDLNNDISRVGAEFADGGEPNQHYLTVDRRLLKGSDPTLARHVSNFLGSGRAQFPTTGYYAIQGLKTIDDEQFRKKLYIAHRTSSKQQVDRLDHLLRLRNQLAKLTGFETYAELLLSDKMVRTPENVHRFLGTIARESRPDMVQELSILQQEKQKFDPQSSEVFAWDKSYLIEKCLSQKRSLYRSPDFLSSYLSLGTVIQGLSRLFSSLYGVRLVPAETTPGETWNTDIRRLDVIDEVKGHIGVVYCDLFERAGKNPNPAHFTLRCCRVISEDEIAEVASQEQDVDVPFDDALTDGMASATDPETGKLYQLPTIALICNFPRPLHGSSAPTLLSFRDYQTLFHEMGHAIHSFLGRTDLQAITGTRCATDFVELPSVLMESFAASPNVLSLFARHHETDEPLPYEMVESYLARQNSFEGISEIANQILLSKLDLNLHGEFSDTTTSRTLYHSLFSDPAWNLIPEPAGTSYQGFFGHLVTYGASYYAYIFDKCLAQMVWSQIFGSGALSIDRSAGEAYKNKILKWGGSKDGWEMIASVFEGTKDEEILRRGNGESMEIVAKWSSTKGDSAGRLH
jgi:intermediate peptidase